MNPIAGGQPVALQTLIGSNFVGRALAAWYW
jgi:hypothetical protein